jgi:hypothetical protein
MRRFSFISAAFFCLSFQTLGIAQDLTKIGAQQLTGKTQGFIQDTATWNRPSYKELSALVDPSTISLEVVDGKLSVNYSPRSEPVDPAMRKGIEARITDLVVRPIMGDYGKLLPQQDLEKLVNGGIKFVLSSRPSPGSMILVDEAFGRAVRALKVYESGYALRLLRHVTSAEPENAAAWTLMAVALYDLGQDPEAIRAAKKGDALAFKTPGALEEISRVMEPIQGKRRDFLDMVRYMDLGRTQDTP